MLKTNYTLGEEPNLWYQSAAMQQFKAPDATWVKPQPKFKNYNSRVHIITGQILNNNYKASGYEAFTEKSQARASGDKAFFPPDRQVSCPITGRMVIGR